jgi:hypothetical protein
MIKEEENKIILFADIITLLVFDPRRLVKIFDVKIVLSVSAR